MVIIDKLKAFFTAKKEVTLSENTRRFYNLMGFGATSFKNIEDEKLIREGYVSNEDLYSIIDKVIATSLTIPISVYKKNKKEWQEIDDKNNELYKFLNKPNLNQTLKEYREEQYLNYLLTGDLFELLTVPDGYNKPTSTRILPSQFITIEYTDNDYFFGEVKQYNFCYGKNYVFNKEDIIHLQKINPLYPCDGKGLSPLHPSYTALSTSNQVHTAEESMIKNRGAIGMLSQNLKEGYGLTPEEEDKLDDDLKERLGGAQKYGKIITTKADLKYIQLGSTVKDLTLTEIDINKLRKFCNVFGLASQLFNDPQNKTFNNLSEAKKSLYTEASIPLAEKLVEHWNKNIVPYFNDGNNEYKLELDIDEIEVLQKDKKLEAEKDKIVTETILSICEKVKLGSIDRETAINILVYANGINLNDAQMLIPNTPPIQNIQLQNE